MPQDKPCDSEDLEVPDAETAKAAQWLSQQSIEFETPTFWLVAGLLANYRKVGLS